MSNFRRRLMMSINKNKLPSGYTELEYIEGTGTQYIDTYTRLNQDSSVELKVQITNTERYNIFGSRSSAISNSFQAIISFSPYANFIADFQNYEINRLNIKPNLNQNIIYISNENLRIGNSIQKIKEYTDFETPDNAFIFDVSGNPSDGYQKAKMKLFYCKIYDNNVLIRDMIPVLDKNNVACMYDKVNKEFYYNQGTGEFLYKEKSLFNTANLQIGYAISASGVINANSNFNCTEFIPVNQSKYIFSGISGKTSDWNLRIHAYDENKNWIKQILLQSISVGKTLDVNFEINDETIKYIRVSIANENFTDYNIMTLKEIK